MEDKNTLLHQRIQGALLENSDELDLTDFSLKKVPKEITKLINLKTIYLSSNQFTDFDHKILQLTQLEYLIMVDNKLRTLPKSVNSLKNLKTLNIKYNKIEVLPSSIGDFEHLESLYLSNNKLEEIPVEIGNLSNLKYLELNNNQLKSLPNELGKLRKLEELKINGNQINNIPIEIIDRGTKSILNYLNSSLAKETHLLFEAKLLIVGAGNVGKTYLMNQLIYGSIDSKTLTTPGIDIKQWTIETSKTKDFIINFWDFGGQEIYHSTHQFFLTKRSLYVFLWEARTDDQIISFDYWLNVIKLLSNNSPVIVVQNKIDERMNEIDEKTIREKFKNIVSFHKVSAREKTGIQDLKVDIAKEIEKLPLVGDRLPQVWLKIRGELENLDKSFIEYQGYIKICKKYGLTNNQAVLLSNYFHDLGVFLHFSEDIILIDILFLKPSWATNAVYKIVDTKAVALNHGKFHFEDLKQIWQDYPEDKYIYLIALMKKFELCFQILNTKEFIVPELLPPGKPNFNWDYNDNLILEYRYKFMPAGIITRFIVRTHDLIQEHNYWKNGVIIDRKRLKKPDLKSTTGVQDDSTSALIISEAINRKIRIWIHGSNKASLYHIIEREFDYIHDSLNNPESELMICCMCTRCSRDSEPYWFQYPYLKLAIKKNRESVECQKSLEQVQISQLIGDFSWRDYSEDSSPNKKERKKLQQQFNDLVSLDNPQKRGYKFEHFLNELFHVSDLQPRKSFRNTGEQIDGSFQLQNSTYLVEARWTSKKVDNRSLGGFAQIVDSKSSWSRGLFITMSGFSKVGLSQFAKGKGTKIIGMDKGDLQLILEGYITLKKAIEIKARNAAEENEMFSPLSTLMERYKRR